MLSTAKKTPPPGPTTTGLDRKIKVKAGDTVECIKSTSPGYTLGRKYEVYLNEEGQRCLKGDDGFEDLWSMLISKFKVVKP